ncbi:MAG: CBS domain-containing protein [Saprospiraceae bacterium]
MIANELISSQVEPLMLTMDGEEALQLMQKYGVLQLPVVSNGEYLGMLSEDDILKYNIERPLEAYQSELNYIYVNKNEHLFDIIKKITDADLNAIAVINEPKQFLGTITRNDLFEYYHKSFAWSEPGSILVIELNNNQYSLSEISHIIEAEQGMIISSIISRPSESKIVLTLKVNKLDVTRIVAALRRYEYDVTGSYSEEEVVDNFKERYDAFMRFLDV